MWKKYKTGKAENIVFVNLFAAVEVAWRSVSAISRSQNYSAVDVAICLNELCRGYIQ